jgi:hypothetical protein
MANAMAWRVTFQAPGPRLACVFGVPSTLINEPQEDQLMTPDFSLRGGVALVTGAGSGIGRAIARGLAGAGAYVGCVDRVPENVEATAAQILATGSRAVPVAADVTDPAALSAAVAQIESALGPLTLGVNAAGIASAAPAESMPEEQWRQVIDVDLTGVFLSCQAEGRAMIRNGGGSIVNIASMSPPSPIAACTRLTTIQPRPEWCTSAGASPGNGPPGVSGSTASVPATPTPR